MNERYSDATTAKWTGAAQKSLYLIQIQLPVFNLGHKPCAVLIVGHAAFNTLTLK